MMLFLMANRIIWLSCCTRLLLPSLFIAIAKVNVQFPVVCVEIVSVGDNMSDQ